MTDDVKSVSQRILDRAADQIGTHSANCHEYHLPCFAAFVMRELEAATSAPAVDREALAKVLEADECYERDANSAGWVFHPRLGADALLASGILRDVRDVQAEALEQAAEAMEAAPGPLEECRETTLEEARYLRDRAQAIREARND